MENPKGKSGRQRQGEEMVLELNAMFPDAELGLIISCVKKANLNFDAALNELLFALEQERIGNKAKEAARQYAAAEQPAAEPVTLSSKPKTTKPESSSSSNGDLRKKYRDELEQVQAILDGAPVSEEVILTALAKYKGDIDQVMVMLLDTVQRSPSSSPPAAESGLQNFVSFTPEAVMVSMAPMTSNVDIAAETAARDGLYFSESEDEVYMYSSGGSDVDVGSGDDFDQHAAEAEVDSWFEDPTAGPRRRPAPADEPDLVLKAFQEDADLEYAMQLQMGWVNQDNERFGGNPLQSLVAFAKSEDNKYAYQPWHYGEQDPAKREYLSRVKRYHDPPRIRTKVEPITAHKVVENPELTKFLREQEERNVAKMMNDDITAKGAPTRTVGPSLQRIFTELKKFKEEMKAANEANPYAKKDKRTNKSTAMEESAVRSALARSREILSGSSEDFFADDQDDSAATSELYVNPISMHLMECLKRQDDEISALKASMTEPVQISDTFPTKVSVTIREPTFVHQIPASKKSGTEKATPTFTYFNFPKPLRLFMIATVPPMYPNTVAPITNIAIRANSLIDQLDPSLLSNLELFLHKRSTRISVKEGRCASLHELADIARTWLERNPEVIDRARELTLRANLESDSNAAKSDYSDSLHHILALDFTLLTSEDILMERSKAIELTQSSLGVAPAAARILLKACSWSVDKLLRECQSDGIDKVFERTGVLSRDAKPIDLDERTQLTSQTFECPGCFEEYSIDDMAGMTCKHFYCKDCFSNYLKIQITESGASTLDAIPCPGHKCKFLVDAVTLASIIDYTLYKRYVGFVAKAYVEANPDIHWCPSSRGCEYAAQINPNSAARTVQCQCGYVYCFKCRQEAHWPASCLEMEWWLKTHPEYRGMDPNEEEARSMQWILQHTQDCPKCFNPIEKNGGCNHLTCRSCGFQFCWVCMGDWSPKHYNCHEFRQRASSSRSDNFEALFSADINLGFLQLWTLTDNSKTQDAELKRRLVQQIKAHVHSFRQKASVSLALCEALLKAVEYVFLCRHIIKTTCIVGQFYTHHKIGGSKKLKPEVRRLNADISFLYSMVTGPLHKLKTAEVLGAVGAIKTSIKHLLIVIGDMRIKSAAQLACVIVTDNTGEPLKKESASL